NPGHEVINYLNNGQPRDQVKIIGFEYFSVVAGWGPAADEVDQLELVAGADDRLREIVAPPDLAVVLDDHPGGLHIELREQVKQGHAVGDPTRLAVQRDRDVGHRRAASTRVTISSWSRRAASAGSTAS